MKIMLLNVKFSPNLGDGLLSECLEAELRAQDAGVSAWSVDLAGRRQFGGGARYRRRTMLILEHLPTALRRRLAAMILRLMVAPALAARCREALRTADAVILGGGNLLADADLNFPIKIGCALGEVAHTGQPVAVLGIGVSDNWSKAGTSLFARALGAVRLVHSAVRDCRSASIWRARLGPSGIATPLVCRDPGLLVSRHVLAPARTGPAPIGLCLTAPVALRYHGSALAGRQLDDWLVALAGELAGLGRPIALFTNGSPEDRAYLRAMAPRLVAATAHVQVTTTPDFRTPGELARFISGCAAVIAHRMHACVAAYSYGVPHVGLAWDPKLESFFASVDRAGYMLDPASVTPRAAARLTDHAMAAGIDPVSQAAILDEAAADIRAAYGALKAACAA